MPRGMKTGSVLAMITWSKCADGVVDDPVPFLLVDHLALSVCEHACRARVEHE